MVSGQKARIKRTQINTLKDVSSFIRSEHYTRTGYGHSIFSLQWDFDFSMEHDAKAHVPDYSERRRIQYARII